jgi:hypothetical protein
MNDSAANMTEMFVMTVDAIVQLGMISHAVYHRAIAPHVLIAAMRCKRSPRFPTVTEQGRQRNERRRCVVNRSAVVTRLFFGSIDVTVAIPARTVRALVERRRRVSFHLG